MNQSEEIKNLDKVFSNPQSHYEITLKIDLGDYPEDIMEKIKFMVKIIIENKDSDWEDDEYWLALLPAWILENIKSYTVEESDALMAKTPKELWDTLPWDLGSWLYMLGERAWFWQGHYRKDNYAEIYLNTIEMAETGSTVGELVRAAGGKIIERCHFLKNKTDGS